MLGYHHCDVFQATGNISEKICNNCHARLIQLPGRHVTVKRMALTLKAANKRSLFFFLNKVLNQCIAMSLTLNLFARARGAKRRFSGHLPVTRNRHLDLMNLLLWRTAELMTAVCQHISQPCCKFRLVWDVKLQISWQQNLREDAEQQLSV